MLVRLARASRTRNIALLACCTVLTVALVCNLDGPVGGPPPIAGWNWYRSLHPKAGLDEFWPPTWEIGQDGRFAVPINAEGLVVTSFSKTTRSTRHPMHHLIRDAKRKWKRMLARQSKTLAEAVEEYIRRYKRLPPKGFDDWYAYAKQKGTILIDEYDMLNTELLPFFALSPEMVIKRRDELSTTDSTYHLIVTNGRVHALTPNTPTTRSIHGLTSDFEHLLPDMKIYGHAHDMSPYMLDKELLRRAKDAVRTGTYIDEAELKQLENGQRNDRVGILKGCASDSPTVLQAEELESSRQNSKSTSRTKFEFIHSLAPYLNYCANPSLLHDQCLFQGAHTRDTELHPLLVQSKSANAGGLLPPSTYMFDAKHGTDLMPWKSRINQVYWRGRTTGCWHELDNWRESHRVRLHMLTNTNTTTDGSGKVVDDIDVLVEEPWTGGRTRGRGFQQYLVGKAKLQEQLKQRTISRTAFNNRFMDVGLIGPAEICHTESGTCDVMNRQIGFLERTVKGTRGETHRYTIDVDGNGWSGRYRGLLSGGSLVLKSTMFPEWMTERMIPYYHYVPIQHDFSDLYNIVSFFTGIPSQNGTSTVGGHEDLAEEIASHSVDFVLNHWRWEDMEVYAFRLLLEYARITSLDRNATSYHHHVV